ncbi:3-hydroxybutyrate dehydrogenase [Paraphotobacterium marinum]|uniref:3-hydroxybutyrate dehydrogenase n=1 Tax=Paraphotobacterium marinum TaxID=1755811 RepID=A0A220VFW4_9GAMM|nr:3-hydroxybutyrate dehydrogenase [Paraphotobacterium marinum]ASK79219.1 3-hydroxybutyrate dehydrogenase [Paraphotobacterium marinum]
MKLKNKVAIVTGSGSGIGKGVALAYASEGAKVVIADLNEETGTKTAQEINMKGGHAIFVRMDITNEDNVNSSINYVYEKYGKIDILVNNAGFKHIEKINELAYQNWKKVISINLHGAFLTTKACLKFMYAAKAGSIIYIGSVSSKQGSKFQAPYVAAKHALLGLCRVVAKEAASHNVSANVICPGYIKTSLLEKQISHKAKVLNQSENEIIESMLSETVNNQFITSKDISDCAVFLASFKTNALTGQSLMVNHGGYME